MSGQRSGGRPARSTSSTQANGRLPTARGGAGAARQGGQAVSQRESGTVFRVLALLEALVEHPDETNSQLATRVDLPRPTVHRLLAMLQQRGFAAHSRATNYTAGPALHRLAGKLHAQLPWARLAGPVLRHLSDAFSETAFLNLLVREKLARFVVLSAAPPVPLRYAVDLNELSSLLWGASSRSILAFLTPAEIEAAILRDDPAPFDGRRIDRDELTRSLERTRNAGFALVRSQRARDAVGIAVPFFDSAGDVRGSVALTVPVERYQEAALKRYAPALKKAASSLSAQLGWTPDEAAR